MITWVFIRNFGETKVLKESEYFPAGTHRTYRLECRGSLPECSIKRIEFKLNLIGGLPRWRYLHLPNLSDREQALANDRKHLLRKLARIYDQYPEYAL